MKKTKEEAKKELTSQTGIEFEYSNAFYDEEAEKWYFEVIIPNTDTAKRFRALEGKHKNGNILKVSKPEDFEPYKTLADHLEISFIEALDHIWYDYNNCNWQLGKKRDIYCWTGDGWLDIFDIESLFIKKHGEYCNTLTKEKWSTVQLFQNLMHGEIITKKPDDKWAKRDPCELEFNELNKRLIQPSKKILKYLKEKNNVNKKIINQVINVAFSSLKANGSAMATTDKLTLVFDKDIVDLSATDIILTPGNTGAINTKDALTRISAGVYELAIFGITEPGSVTVDVNKNGYAISPASQNVNLHLYVPVKFSALKANGSASATTDKLTLTFDKDITLTEKNISFTPGNTGAKTGALIKTGTYVYELAVSGITGPGSVTVGIIKSVYAFSPVSLSENIYHVAAVAFSTLKANGSETATTDRLILAFDKDIVDLTENDIQLNSGNTGAVKGTLTRITTGVYELPISGITASGIIIVGITKNGYVISPASQNVNIFLSVPVTFSELKANGSTITATNKLTFAFNKEINGLTEDNILLNFGNKNITKGILNRTGTGVYELPVKGITAHGPVSVGITKNGYAITPSSRDIIVNNGIKNKFKNLSVPVKAAILIVMLVPALIIATISTKTRSGQSSNSSGQTPIVSTGNTSGDTSGITTGVTSGITTGVTSGVTTGDTSGVTTGVTSGITTGVTSGVPPRSTSESRPPELDGNVRITGPALVGEKLTADAALIGSGVDTYEWRTEDGTIILSGVDKKTYIVQNADVGKTINVTVTRLGYIGSRTNINQMSPVKAPSQPIPPPPQEPAFPLDGTTWEFVDPNTGYRYLLSYTRSEVTFQVLSRDLSSVVSPPIYGTYTLEGSTLTELYKNSYGEKYREEYRYDRTRRSITNLSDRTKIYTPQR